MAAAPLAHPPRDIPHRPDIQHGLIPVETAPLAPQAQQASDIAGVLKRNQACLACRRRKLKCDAVRPHCGTCVRSHKHTLRTAPASEPVLACEYDDGDAAGGAHSPHSADADADDDGKKKKRKATGGRRKKDDDDNDERERLARRVEELEQMLARKTLGHDAPAPLPPPVASAFQPTSADSPTAFLEMLSSAASAQAASAPQPPPDFAIPGMRDGAAAPTLMGGFTATWISADRSESTGLTPFLNMVDSPRPLDEANAPGMGTDSSSVPTLAGSSRPSLSGQSGSHNGAQSSTADTTPSGPAVLSPGYVFNFSPAATGPGTGPPQNLQYSFPIANGGLQPSTLTEGPWRAVETVATVLPDSLAAGSGSADDLFGSGGQTIDMDAPTGDVQMDEALQQQLLLDLFWPGWPPTLPEPHVTTALVESFFDLVPNLPRLIHRARLLARLQLPPTHSNFPHPALIHAMCASAAAWCAPSIYEGSAAFKAPKGSADPSMTFGARQAAHAKDAVTEGLNTGNRLFDVVRAMIILSRVFIDDTRMLECWAYSGLVSRMILPLGLNVRSAELSLKSVMLPPAADALEREERRVIVWMALYHDTIASAASGWGTSMSIEELSIPLPVSAKDFELGSDDMDSNPQDLDSLDFWIKHPVVDPFVLLMKATIVLNRVNRFVRRWKNRRLREDDDLDGMVKPEFRELANAIACLQMSFPASLRDPAKLNRKGCLDVDLISAHLLPQAAIICLFEPFADVTDPNDQPARRILAAAQSIIGVIQQIASTVTSGGSLNLQAVMHSSTSVALVTASRTLLLFYRHALNVNDTSQAEALRSEIELARMMLDHFGLRFKLGHHHAQLIGYFFDRVTNASYEKLAAHYPEHPRPGAPELTPNSDFGRCILNALNIKRGFWKSVAGETYLASPAATSSAAASGVGSSGTSPFGTGSATGTGTTPGSSIGSERRMPSAGDGRVYRMGVAADAAMYGLQGGAAGADPAAFGAQYVSATDYVSDAGWRPTSHGMPGAAAVLGNLGDDKAPNWRRQVSDFDDRAAEIRAIATGTASRSASASVSVPAPAQAQAASAGGTFAYPAMPTPVDLRELLGAAPQSDSAEDPSPPDTAHATTNAHAHAHPAGDEQQRFELIDEPNAQQPWWAVGTTPS
ncbi:hypothetical protein Q5752_002854 [Cryptotrichosporon argae]